MTSQQFAMLMVVLVGLGLAVAGILVFGIWAAFEKLARRTETAISAAKERELSFFESLLDPQALIDRLQQMADAFHSISVNPQMPATIRDAAQAHHLALLQNLLHMQGSVVEGTQKKIWDEADRLAGRPTDTRMNYDTLLDYLKEHKAAYEDLLRQIQEATSEMPARGSGDNFV